MLNIHNERVHTALCVCGWSTIFVTSGDATYKWWWEHGEIKWLLTPHPCSHTYPQTPFKHTQPCWQETTMCMQARGIEPMQSYLREEDSSKGRWRPNSCLPTGGAYGDPERPTARPPTSTPPVHHLSTRTLLSTHPSIAQTPSLPHAH